MKTILVTGASGYIGCELIAALLDRGYMVIGTDDIPFPLKNAPNFKFIRASATNKNDIVSTIQNSNLDAVIHAAYTADNDLRGEITPEIMEASRITDGFIYKAVTKANIKTLILMSTVQIYNIKKTREPIYVEHEQKPQTEYGKLKLASELALANCLDMTKTKALSLRLAPIYTKKFTQNLHDRVYDYKENVTYLCKDGLYAFSLCCLYNLIDFIISILTQPADVHYEGIYNIADPIPLPVTQIIDFEKSIGRIGPVMQRSTLPTIMALPAAKNKADYRYIDPATFTSSILYDNSKAQRFCSFRWNLNNTK